jgi:pimeloyl-ACP methyl ester carboxylesterase
MEDGPFFLPGKRKRLRNFSLGAGLLGAFVVGMRFAMRRPAQLLVPDSISPAIFATKAAHTSAGQVVYHESGSGQPLIFIHGIYPGASSYEWSKVYPDFTSRFRVLAPDWIGCGESQRPKARLFAADYVRMLAEFIRATCGQERPVLIASGLGAGLCVYLASQHPELVSRLILHMPTAQCDLGRRRVSWGMKLASRIPMLARLVYRRHFATEASVRAWLAAQLLVDPALVTDEMAEVLTTCGRQYGAEYSIYNLFAGRFGFDLEARMKMLALPVTLLWGDQAMYPQLEWAYRLQPAVRNCTLLILDKTGPLAPLEAPARLLEVLRAQLESELGVFKVI